MLTLGLILYPALAATLILLIKGERVKQAALVAALVELAFALAAFIHFKPDATSQFGFDYAWIGSLGIRFSAGIDGISVLLVLLTGLLVPLIVLSTFNRNYPRPAPILRPDAVYAGCADGCVYGPRRLPVLSVF